MLGLSLYVLLKNDIFEELLRCLVLIQQVQHEHNHYFDRFLIQFGQVELVLLLLSWGCFFFLQTILILILILILLVFIILLVESKVLHDLKELWHDDVAINL